MFRFSHSFFGAPLFTLVTILAFYSMNSYGQFWGENQHYLTKYPEAIQHPDSIEWNFITNANILTMDRMTYFEYDEFNKVVSQQWNTTRRVLVFESYEYYEAKQKSLEISGDTIRLSLIQSHQTRTDLNGEVNSIVYEDDTVQVEIEYIYGPNDELLNYTEVYFEGNSTIDTASLTHYTFLYDSAGERFGYDYNTQTTTRSFRLFFDNGLVVADSISGLGGESFGSTFYRQDDKITSVNLNYDSPHPSNEYPHYNEENAIYWIKHCYEEREDSTLSGERQYYTFYGGNEIVLPVLEGSVDNNIQGFPNPVSREIHFPNANGFEFIEVYNSNGEFIGKFESSALDVSSFPQGIYWAQFSDKKRTRFVKF